MVPDPKQTTEIDEEEWKLAEEFFQQNPDATKFVRKSSATEEKRDKASEEFLKQKGKQQLSHSFIKVTDDKGVTRIVALEPNKVFLGEGGFGVVKKAYARDGRMLAVKIQVGEINADIQAENDLLIELGRGHGITQRILPYEIRQKFSSERIKHKTYMLEKFIPGTNLVLALEERKFSEGGACQVAYQCATLIKQLHDSNILHGDIAARNFMINDKNQVFLIDFGSALRISLDDTGRRSTPDMDISEVKPGGPFPGGFLIKPYLLKPYLNNPGIVRMDETFDVRCFANVLRELRVDIGQLEKRMWEFNPSKRPIMDDIVDAIREKLVQLGAEIPTIQSHQSVYPAKDTELPLETVKKLPEEHGPETRNLLSNAGVRIDTGVPETHMTEIEAPKHPSGAH